MEEKNTNKLGVMPIPKLLITMAVPLILSMMVQSLYSMVDSMWVARVSETALTAVTLCYPAQNVLMAFAVGTGVGVSSFLSRSLGEQNPEQANATAEHAIFLWAFWSIIFATIGLTCGKAFLSFQTQDEEIINYGTQYFRICLGMSFGAFGQLTCERLLQSTGRTVETMVMQVTGAVVNMILDPIFIFGLDLGVIGAGYATVIGQCTAASIGLFLNITRNEDIRIKMKEFRLQKDIIKGIYQVGFPTTIMISVNSFISLCMNLILIGFTSTATAVFGIYYKLQDFFFMPLYGIKNALIPIIAYNYGAKQRQRISDSIKLALKIVMCMMVVGSFVFFTFPSQLLGFFDAGEHMLEIGVPALKVISMNFPFAGLAIALSAALDATGRGKESLTCSMVRQLGTLLPAAYLLSLLGNVNYVWFAFPMAEFTGSILTVYFVRKMFKNLEI